jgi:hypothetical protein
MRRKTFLSIDMDFFNLDGTAMAMDFLDKVLRLKVPTKAVMNHQQMLSMVNKSGANYLLNVDAHSDLVPFTTRSFECGSWVTFVKWADIGTYHWWGRNNSGDCTGGYFPIFSRRGVSSKPKAIQQWAWKKLKVSYTDQLPRLADYGVIEACVCMSPSYANSKMTAVFRQWIKDNKIPYRRGVFNETMKWTYKTPPARKGEQE